MNSNAFCQLSLDNPKKSVTKPHDFSNYHKTFEYMRSILASLMPEDEIAIKAELVCEIDQLKKTQNALILGHNYMEAALYHTIADICGDSLMLAKKGAKCPNPIIVVCGVRFMAETAKILSPEKKILLPSLKAGCSLAASISAEDVRDLRKLYPKVPIVSYVNTYAEVKAESDICCTSANAHKVIEYLNEPMVIFLPDRYLAANVAKQTNRSLIVASKSESGELVSEIISGGNNNNDNINHQHRSICSSNQKNK